MTSPAPVAALLATALLLGGAAAPGAGSGEVSRPAAALDSPRRAVDGPAPTTSQIRYAWPLHDPSAVARRFAIGPWRWSPGHRGIDVGTTVGVPVLAAADGRVTFAGTVAGRPVVVVQHADGVRTTYQPVVATVVVRAVVARGKIIGTLGPDNGHCGTPCLHWGALRGDTYLDPQGLLPRRTPILLPLTPSP